MNRIETLLCCLCVAGLGFMAWVNNGIRMEMAEIKHEVREVLHNADGLQRGRERLSQADGNVPQEVEITPPALSAGEPGHEYVGEFVAFAYCPCRACCGKWADGITASGTVATEGRTIAADWSVLPAGTVVCVDGEKYTVEDKGVSGQKLDIFFENHNSAVEFGVKKVQVWKSE